MSFRRRLVVFLFATLALLQASTALFTYIFTRSTLVEQGKAQLILDKDLFVQQLDEIGVQIAAGVEVLTLDYALRQAIAEREHGTVLSALRNHGKRVGATRMQLVELDGTVEVDTGDAAADKSGFGFPELIETAAANGSASSIVMIDSVAFWMVVVPVRAPVPIAFIAAGVPVDDQLLRKIQGLAGLPKALALATDGGDGAWT
ncbi:MAG: cache domain-containing protein, partial [Aliidongia sp.]